MNKVSLIMIFFGFCFLSCSSNPDTPNNPETPKTPATQNTPQTPETPNTSKTPATQNTSKTPETPNTSKTPATQNTPNTLVTHKTSATPKTLFTYKTSFTPTDTQSNDVDVTNLYIAHGDCWYKPSRDSTERAISVFPSIFTIGTSELDAQENYKKTCYTQALYKTAMNYETFTYITMIEAHPCTETPLWTALCKNLLQKSSENS